MSSLSLDDKVAAVKEFLKENRKVIAFTGMHGSGKTTMLNTLAKKLDLPVLVEPCRLLLPALNARCIDIELFQRKSLDLWYFFYNHLWNKTSSSFLCDRIHVDIHAYWSLTEPDYGNIKYFDRFLAERHGVITPPKYDFVIRFDELPIDPSKDRRVFTDEQEDALREMLPAFAESYGLTNILNVCSDVREERLDAVISWLYSKTVGSEGDL